MKVIVGLGNPGVEYQNTRHNAGILLVEKLASRIQESAFSYGWRRNKATFLFETPEIILAKTAGAFMNESGRMITDLDARRYALDAIYLAHDDLDIRLGEYKIQKGIGPKVHNGIESVENALKTKDFLRVRIGIDNRIPENRTPGEQYVLQRFTSEELQVLDSVLEKICHDLLPQS